MFKIDFPVQYKIIFRNIGSDYLSTSDNPDKFYQKTAKNYYLVKILKLIEQISNKYTYF